MKRKTQLFPSPQELYKRAEGEQQRLRPSDYHDAMVALYERGFSYRAVADWLKQFGARVDHMQVYRQINKKKGV